jgi:hypothetical protein
MATENNELNITEKEQEQPEVKETVISKEDNGDVTITEESAPTEEPAVTEETTDSTVSADMFDEQNAEENTTTAEPGGYDLGQYNLGDQATEMIQPSLDRFAEAGITQEQLDVVFSEIIGEPTNYSPDSRGGIVNSL